MRSNHKALGRWLPVFLLTVIVFAFVLGRLYGLGERLSTLQDWIRSMGPWGPAVFVGIFIATALAAFPVFPLSLAAGALFGSVMGTVLVSIAATAGASLGFLVSRYVARDAVARWLSKKEKFRKLDDLIEANGAVVVAFMRLVPVFPFNLLNYGFGLTRVPFRTYLFWSWLCMLPGDILYVGGADAVTKGVVHGRVPWALAAALAVTGLSLMFLIHYTRGRMQGP